MLRDIPTLTQAIEILQECFNSLSEAHRAITVSKDAYHNIQITHAHRRNPQKWPASLLKALKKTLTLVFNPNSVSVVIQDNTILSIYGHYKGIVANQLRAETRKIKNYEAIFCILRDSKLHYDDILSLILPVLDASTPPYLLYLLSICFFMKKNTKAGSFWYHYASTCLLIDCQKIFLVPKNQCLQEATIKPINNNEILKIYTRHFFGRYFSEMPKTEGSTSFSNDLVMRLQLCPPNSQPTYLLPIVRATYAEANDCDVNMLEESACKMMGEKLAKNIRPENLSVNLA